MKPLSKLFHNLQEFGDSGLHVGEAYIIWTQLQARYDTLELLQYFDKMAKDLDFRTLIGRGTKDVVMPQIEKLEKLMSDYQIPAPPRPPADMNIPLNHRTARDEHMFRVIFDGSQTALLVHIKSINICINDSLRNTFMGFLTDELHMYDNLIKYGKIKGWVHKPPAYKLT